MEIKDLTAILVVAMVGCILVAGFIPVVGESVSATTTFENDGIYYIVNDEESHTLIFENQTLTVDGEIVSHPQGEYTVLATDDILFRLTSGGERLQLRGALTGSVVSCALTIANGTVTGSYINPSDQTTSVSSAYTSYWLATSFEEPLIMKAYSGSAYIKDDTVVMGRGLTRLLTGANTDTWQYMQIDASVNDGVTINEIEGFTFSNKQFNVTPIEGYNGLYQFASITFTATHIESGTTTDVTYSAVIVPAEVTAEKTIHADANTASILSMIPFILIMGIVLMFVGVVLVRRYV